MEVKNNKVEHLQIIPYHLMFTESCCEDVIKRRNFFTSLHERRN